ncbi:MAG: F0F1 ATP synthase subunit epsilon [Lentisphaerae bacterium GWF2_38_69]|nr:MAG: F0F1 ATP synthase subunit epsilon [Lentisphaerae bacterium GWF2_38_69]
MNLKILLPFKVFAEKKGVKRIIAETPEGSFGILPHRLDCTSLIAPGILVYETDADGETYTAVDEGILVKEGTNVTVSIRNAVGGTDLDKLKEAVENEFIALTEEEKNMRMSLAKIERGFVRQFMELKNS